MPSKVKNLKYNKLHNFFFKKNTNYNSFSKNNSSNKSKQNKKKNYNYNNNISSNKAQNKQQLKHNNNYNNNINDILSPNSTNHIKMISWNVRSLNLNKIYYLNEFKNYDIIFLQETNNHFKKNDQLKNELLSFTQSYNYLQFDSTMNNKKNSGFGVITLINKDFMHEFQFTKFSIKHIVKDRCHLIHLFSTYHNQNLYLFNIYQYAKKCNEYDEMFNTITKYINNINNSSNYLSIQHIILAGDFNSYCNKHMDNKNKNEHVNCQSYTNFTRNNKLHDSFRFKYPFNIKFSYKRNKNIMTRIDTILCSNLSNISDNYYLPFNNFSDHRPFSLKYYLSLSKYNYKNHFNYFIPSSILNCPLKHIKKGLFKFNFKNTTKNEKFTQYMIDNFQFNHDIFNSIPTLQNKKNYLDQHLLSLIKYINIGSRKFFKHSMMNWINYNKNKSYQKKVKLWNKLKKRKQLILKRTNLSKSQKKGKIKLINKKIKQILKDCKRQNAINIFYNFYNNQEKVYEFVKEGDSFNNNGESLNCLKLDNDNYSIESDDVRKHIRDYYSNILSANSVPIQSRNDDQYDKDLIYNSTALKNNDKINKLKESFKLEDLIKCINNLDKKKACGLDNVYTEHLKLLSNNHLEFILFYFNFYFKHNLQFPDFPFKLSYIKLIHKNGNKNMVENYRPITLISNISKLLSLLILNKFNSINHSFLSSNQTSFQSLLNCNINLTKLASLIEIHKLKKDNLILTYLDIKKAYDTVPIQSIHQTLLSLNIPNNLINLIINSLSNNKTMINTCYGLTNEIIVKRGVRQGCPLSPLLFNLFIDRLCLKLNSNQSNTGAMFYADDMLLYSSTKSQLIQQIKQSFTFFLRNKMSISIKKSCYQPNSSDFEDSIPKRIHINDQIEPLEMISYNESYKYLGINISTSLKWRDHFNYIYNKIKKRINVLKTYLDAIPCNLFIRIINTAIIPLITYGSSIIKYTNSQKNSFNKLINHTVKKKFKLRKCDSIIPLYAHIGLKDFNQEMKIESLDTFHYIMNLNTSQNHIVKTLHKYCNEQKLNTWIDKIYKYSNEFNVSWKEGRTMKNPFPDSYDSLRYDIKQNLFNYWQNCRKSLPLNCNVYTDGSVKGENIGYSIIVKEDESLNQKGTIVKEWSIISPSEIIPNNNYNKIYQAELFAIVIVTMRLPKNAHCNVYSDSTSVVKTVNSLLQWKEYNDLKARNLTCKSLLYMIYSNIHSKNISLFIHHIKAHNGNIYNEKADKLAKEGSEMNKYYSMYFCNKNWQFGNKFNAVYNNHIVIDCKLRNVLSAIVKQNQIKQWKSLDSQGRYANYLLHPNCTNSFKSLLNNNSLIHTIVRARMRALPCMYYLNKRFPDKFDKHCKRCHNHTETQRHLFLQCNKVQTKLMQLNQSIAVILKESSNDLFLLGNGWFNSWFSQYKFNIQTGEVKQRNNLTEQEWLEKEAMITGGYNESCTRIFNKLKIPTKKQLKIQRLLERYIKEIWLERCKETH